MQERHFNRGVGGLFPSKTLDPLILGIGFMILKVFNKGIWLNIALFSGGEALYCIALGMVSLLTLSSGTRWGWSFDT